MLTAHQVADLAFHFRPGRTVSLDPGRVFLLFAGLGQALLVATDLDAAPGTGVGALRPQRAHGAGLPEVGGPVSVLASSDRGVLPVGAGHRVAVEVDVELVFGELARRGVRGLGLAVRLDVGLGQDVLELPGAVGGVAVDVRLGLRFAVVLIAAEEVLDQVGGERSVPDVAGADLGAGDDLTVGIDRQMAFVAVETPCSALVAVAGLGVTVEMTRSFATRRAIRNFPSARSVRR